uniref:Uncharacterized protein n=1 Tax=Anguilla anguilla TaxID=7936 RepID=A0A0E9QNG7_ANGAN
MRRCKTQYWLLSLVNHCNIRYHMILYLCSDWILRKFICF